MPFVSFRCDVWFRRYGRSKGIAISWFFAISVAFVTDLSQRATPGTGQHQGSTQRFFPIARKREYAFPGKNVGHADS